MVNISWIIYLLITFLVVLAISAYWYFTRQRPETLEDQILRYTLQHSDYPRGYTLSKLSDGTYRNVDVDSEGKLQIQIGDKPIDPTTGTLYEQRPHGKVELVNNTGFRVEGMLQTVNCPDQWTWNEAKKICVPPPICDGLQDKDYIKGITQYQFDLLPILDQAEKMDIYHARLYAICGDEGKYTFGNCSDNKKFNQKAKQPANVDPCVFYDICSEHEDGFKHKKQINDYILKPNEYYVCVSGKSELNECVLPLVFSETFNSCIAQSPCFGKPNNETIPIDDKSFLRCLNDIDYLITCPLGVYTGDGPTNLACNKNVCQTVQFTDFYYNKNVNIPISVQYCVNNVPLELNCFQTTNSFNYNLDVGTIFAFPKAYFYNNDLNWSNQRALLNNPPVCQPVDNFSDINDNEVVDDLITVSYNDLTPNDNWDWRRNKPPKNNVFYVYYNVFGKIVRVVDDTTVGLQKDFLPIMGDERVHQYAKSFGTVERPDIDPMCGYSVNDIVYTVSNPLTKPEGSRFALFMYMLFPLDDGNFRFVYGTFVSNPSQNETTIRPSDPTGLIYVADCVPQLIDTANYVKLNATPSLPKGSLAPPLPNGFNCTYPSTGGTKRVVTYYTSGITWYGKFAEKQVQPHIFQCFKYDQIEELITTPKLFRAVASFRDDWLEPIEKVLGDIDVKSLIPTSAFTDPLPTHLRELFQYDYSYLVEVGLN